MKILISGGRKKTRYLLQSLNTTKHKVVVVNKDKDFCKVLSREFKNVAIIHGDATVPDTLEDAGVYNFDLGITLCNQDTENLVIGLLLKNVFTLDRVVSIVNTPHNVNVFKELGVTETINSAKVIAGIIEQHAFVQSLKMFMPLEDENLLILDIEVTEKSPVITRAVESIKLPSDAVITAILRDGKATIAKPKTILEHKDRIIITTLKKTKNKVIKAISGA
ncbi:MAG: potassium channel family protein [Bacillota bacterium]